jgi:hypothetical protein
MRKNPLLPLLLFLCLAFVSCEDDIFGPASLEGEWNVTEKSNAFGEQGFLVAINYSPDRGSIIISNFAQLGLGVEVVAGITELNLTIPFQSVQASGGTFRISGSGTATSNLRKINWKYKIDGEDYTAVFMKQ